jgi:hypothetical protein
MKPGLDKFHVVPHTLRPMNPVVVAFQTEAQTSPHQFGAHQ